MVFLPPFLRLISNEVFLLFQCVTPALLVRNVYGCEPPFLRGNDGAKSGYIVKGGTVRGYWNTREADSGTEREQIRYKSGTEAVQNRNRSGTKPGQKWDICRAVREQIARRATETNAR
jgi:hypothetical protein